MGRRTYDVAIAGGGPAGAAAAIVLARAGLRVLLADGGGEREFRIGEGLPPSARRLLHELGILERILADGHRPSPGTLAFWGTDAPLVNDFMFQLHGHGLQLDRVRFDAQLRATAREAGAEVVESTRLQFDVSVHDSAVSPHRLRLRRDGGDELKLEARWLIDASGRPATLARQLGATHIRHDRQLAFYQRLRSERGSDRDGRTLVEAVENGWWYSALLPAGERLVAFLGDADLIERRALLESEGLWVMLQQTMQLRVMCAEHGYRPHGRTHGADASSTELHPAAGTGWLAVGDAAVAFNPISSKGISNALYTGSRGAQVLLDHGCGDVHAFARYANHLRDIHRIYREQLRIVHAVEKRWPQSAFWKRRRIHDDRTPDPDIVITTPGMVESGGQSCY